MKKYTVLLLALMMLTMSVPAQMETAGITLGDYQPKVDRLTIQTQNRNVPEGSLNDQWLEEQMGVAIDWLIIPDQGEQATKLNLLASSGNLPDIMCLSNRVVYEDFLRQGLLLPLDDLIPTCAPNVYTCREEGYLEYLRHTDGKLYALNNTFVANREILLTRKDWVETLGLEMPDTIDEFYDMVHAFVYNDPDGNGADDTYGYFATGNSLLYNFNLIWFAFGANPEQWVRENDAIVYGPTQAQMKNAVAFLQKMYAEGLIAKDYLTLTQDNRNEGLYAGKLGLVTGAFNYCDSYWAEWHADPKAVWTGLMGLQNPGGEKGYLSSATPYVPGSVTSISVDSKDPQLAMLYINLLAQKETFLHIVRGIEGEHYTFDEAGMTHFLEPYFSDNTLLYNQGITYTYTIPFMWREYSTLTVQEDTLQLLYQRIALEKDYYSAMPYNVPDIVDQGLSDGMLDYVKSVVHGLIINGGDVDAELDKMSQTLYDSYHLKAQEGYVNAYAQTLGLK